jgi:hypothetical protein
MMGCKCALNIGEADCVRERIAQSAGTRGFWEHAVVVTTSDEALTKGHIRYLEARLIEMTRIAGRVKLDNSQSPEADRRRLPEADRSNMEAFLANLKIVLPVVGLDLLKIRPRSSEAPKQIFNEMLAESPIRFEIQHRSGVKAQAEEIGGEFVVLKNSESRKDTGNVGKGYQELKNELIKKGILKISSDPQKYYFDRDYEFSSPPAAAAVVLDRNANGRIEWKISGSDTTYHQWQSAKNQ